MDKILQFKITLTDSKPLVWRRFHITDDFRIDRFHQVIQILMGWKNYHLHDFRIHGREIGMIDEWVDEYQPRLEDETCIYLEDFEFEKGDVLLYRYDYGDDWEHELKIEKITSGFLSAPSCLEGKNATPPEDCGGMSGYRELLKILKKPAHPEYNSWRKWLPRDFDPDHYNIRAVNKELSRFANWHWRHPEAVSTPWHQI